VTPTQTLKPAISYTTGCSGQGLGDLILAASFNTNPSSAFTSTDSFRTLNINQPSSFCLIIEVDKGDLRPPD
jgi:hypothetical protein